MITVSIMSLAVGISLAVFLMYYFPKKKIEEIITKKALFFPFLTGFLVFAGAIGLYVGATKSSALETMRQRINEPVISEAQLYGYEIVGKHMEEYGSSDNTSYFIDIRDRLTNKKILKHIKASKQLFERIEIGNGFDWSLMDKLKVPELEIPTPEDLQRKEIKK